MYCRHLVSLLAGALLLLSACDGSVGPQDPNATPVDGSAEALVNGTLTPNTSVSFLAAPAGHQLLYTMSVPAEQNTVKFTTTGGTGNADMFVYFDGTPTPANAHCASTQAGSVETCTVSGRPAAGTWYVLLSATASFSNVTLTGTYSSTGTSTSPVRALNNGIPSTISSGVLGEWRTWTVPVPTGQAGLRVDVSGGTGDVELFLRYGSAPTLTTHDCRSSNTGTTQSCQVSSSQAGTWYVMLRGYTAYTDVTLTANIIPHITPLQNGSSVANLSGTTDTRLYYSLSVPAGQSLLKVTLTGSTGDADLYVRRAALPTTVAYDCRGYSGGSNETCSLTNPAADTYNIMVRGHSAFSGVTLLATTVSNGVTGIPLVNGQPTLPLGSADGSPSLFRLEVPASTARLVFEVPTGTTGDYAMYVKHGSEPTTTRYDCMQGSTYGGSSTCTFAEPQAGTWYVLLKAAAPENVYSNLKLTGRYSGVVRNLTLERYQPVTDLSASGDDLIYATLEVPLGQKRLAVWVHGGTGQGWVYARFGSKPSPTSYTYACREYIPTACSIENPQAGTWHFLVTPSSGSPLVGQSLTAGYNLAFIPTQALVNGQPTTGLSGNPADVRTFSLEVPPNQARLQIAASGGTGAVTMRARLGSHPTMTTYDCFSPCDILRPGAGTWYVTLWGMTPYSGASVVATYTAPKPLSNFTTEPGILKQPTWSYYSFEVPAGRTGLSFVASGFSAPNLYVKRGALPTPTDNDCASAHPGTSIERCDFFDPQEGTWYVLVQLTSFGTGDSRDLSVLAGHSETGPISTVVDGEPIRVAGARGSFQTFQLEVPEGQAYLLAEVLDSGKYAWAGNEIWIQHEAFPTYFSYQCQARNVCEVPTPAAGTWFITVFGSGAFDGALRVTTRNKDLRPLVSGIPEYPLGVTTGSTRYWRMEVPAGATNLDFNLVTGSDPDKAALLRVRYGAQPNSYQYDCERLAHGGLDGNCNFANPTAGTWYVSLAADGGSLARLTATYAMTPAEGVPEFLSHGTLSGLSGADDSQKLWRIEVPPGQSMLWFAMKEGWGSAYLRVKHGSRPVGTGISEPCRSTYPEGSVTCAVPNPTPGTWFVMLVGSLEYRNATLNGGYYAADTVTPLTNGVPMPHLRIEGAGARYFKLDVPAGQEVLTFDVNAFAEWTGDIQAHIAREALPTDTSTPCTEPKAGVLRCQVLSPEAGTWYIRVKSSPSHAYTFNHVRLAGFHGAAADAGFPVLLLGDLWRGISGGSTTVRLYKFMVPEGMKQLQVRLGTDGWPSYGVVDLRVRRGSPPTATERDCASERPNTQMSCQVWEPEPGLWYASVSQAAGDTAGFRDMWLVPERLQ
ncbi:PPC domain-containing protein [Pyxidicoccus sp. 3LG]